jgi:hypothetical protein
MRHQELSVLVLKRGKGRGFSGVENELFVNPKASMLFGDARQSLLDLGLQIKEAQLAGSDAPGPDWGWRADGSTCRSRGFI